MPAVATFAVSKAGRDRPRQTEQPLDSDQPSHYVLVMFTSTNHAWNAAFARNTEALKAILAQLLGLLTIHGGTEALKVPRAVHATILRVLRPAESALRRLIVIAARDVKVTAPHARAKPAQPIPKQRNARNRASRQSFQLFDPRKRFGQRRVTYASIVPRVSFIAPDPPFTPLAARPPEPQRISEPEPGKDIGARRLCLRLKAIAAALENVPHQAKRLVRWQARRENKKIFIAALRPGRPPGHRSVPSHSIDFILAECHKFAMGVLSEQGARTLNTS